MNKISNMLRDPPRWLGILVVVMAVVSVVSLVIDSQEDEDRLGCQYEVNRQLIQSQTERTEIAAKERELRLEFTRAMIDTETDSEKDALRRAYIADMKAQERRREKFPLPAPEETRC